MINSLECGDLSPLSNVSELLGKSGDKSPHSKELSYPHAIHIRGEASLIKRSSNFFTAFLTLSRRVSGVILSAIQARTSVPGAGTSFIEGGARSMSLRILMI